MGQIKHGHSRKFNQSAEYTTWQRLKARCYSETNPSYPDYGGRGIYVCKRWRNSFPRFLADMGERPSDRHSLGRIDNDGPYSPANCRWETDAQQARNKRNNVWVVVAGEKMILRDACAKLGVDYRMVLCRRAAGKSVEELLIPNRRLGYEKARAIRKIFARGETTKEALAKEYGVTPTMIYWIVNNKSWVEPK